MVLREEWAGSFWLCYASGGGPVSSTNIERGSPIAVYVDTAVYDQNGRKLYRISGIDHTGRHFTNYLPAENIQFN